MEKKAITKEAIQARVAKAMNKFENKPEWLKKRAQADHATNYLRKVYKSA